MKDFAQQDVVFPKHRPDRGLVLFAQTVGVSDAQLQGGFYYQNWAIPDDIGRDLCRRNQSPVSLREAKFGDGLIVDDYERFKRQMRPFAGGLDLDDIVNRAHPGTKAYLWLSLPGYSNDKKKCVIRFDFGPTAQSASATYLLEIRNGKWMVLNRTIVYHS